MTCPLQIYYGQKNFQYIRKLPDIFVYFLIYKTQFPNRVGGKIK